MSLTRAVKVELTRPGPLPQCCDPWELKALLARLGVIPQSSAGEVMSLSVDYVAVARRLYSLFRGAGVASPQIVKHGGFSRGRYTVIIKGREQVESLLVYLGLRPAGRRLSLYGSLSSLPKRPCCRRSFLRGLFLAGGSVSVRSGYHLEINCGTLEDAGPVMGLLKGFHLEPRIRKRNKRAFIYFKSAEAVADFLRVTGAGSSLLDLESQRVLKSMRNSVNRLVNCESANLEKVVNSAQAQLNMIAEAEKLIGLDNLTPALREAAYLRIRHPEASLKELGEMLDPPVGKSGMNHRFRQIEKAVRLEQETCQSEYCGQEITAGRRTSSIER